MIEDITVILNGYRRYAYLRDQLDHIKAQTIQPKAIWLWINRDERADQPLYTDSMVQHGVDPLDFDAIIDCSVNFKYHGRFSAALLATTKYIAMFDDDTVPGKKWFQNCLDTLERHPGSILGGAGITCLSRQQYMHHRRDGWPRPTTEDSLTDLVGHAWFFEKSKLHAMWAQEPPSLQNGEDMHLCFSNYMADGTETYCPPHPPEDKEMWSSLKAQEYGAFDGNASSDGTLIPQNEFFAQRDAVLQHYFALGYKPALLRKK